MCLSQPRGMLCFATLDSLSMWKRSFRGLGVLRPAVQEDTPGSCPQSCFFLLRTAVTCAGPLGRVTSLHLHHLCFRCVSYTIFPMSVMDIWTTQIFTETVPFADLLEAQAIIKLAQGGLPPRPTDPIVLERGCDDEVWNLMTECWRFKAPQRPSMEEVKQRMTLQLEAATSR